MGHNISLFYGPLPPLRAIAAVSSLARVFALAPKAQFYALPLTEAVRDDVHARLGTGDWLENGPMLTSTDMALAARASRGAALAYVETDYSGGTGRQNAVLWRDGALVLQPAELAFETTRPVSLWPINAVLRALGVVASAGSDEFEAAGLASWRSNDHIAEGAQQLRL